MPLDTSRSRFTLVGMKALVLVFVAVICFSSCKTSNPSTQTGGKEDLSGTLLQAAVGSLDPTASSRIKLKNPRRVRLAIWDKGLALLHASSLKVYFDSDQRPSSWRVNLVSTTPLSTYAGTSSVQTLGAWQGLKVSRLKGGLLEGTLVTQKGPEFNFYANAYAVRYQSDLSIWAGKK